MINDGTNVVSITGGRHRPSFDELADEIRRRRSAGAVDLGDLTPGQRAMVAARLVTVRHGGRHLPQGAITQEMAAQWVGTASKMIGWALSWRSQGSSPEAFPQLSIAKKAAAQRA